MPRRAVRIRCDQADRSLAPMMATDRGEKSRRRPSWRARGSVAGCGSVAVMAEYLRVGSGSTRAKDEQRAGGHVPVAGDHAQLRASQLGRAGGAAQLMDGLGYVVHPGDVRLGEQAAVRVHWHLAARPEPGVECVLRALAALAEPEFFELPQDDEGEAVVDLGEVEVGRGQAELAEHPAGRLGQPELEHVRPADQVVGYVRVPFAAAE